MSQQPEEWVRRDSNIKAMLVTYDNTQDVADWCRGTIERDDLGNPRIKVKVFQPTPGAYSRLRPSTARIGDWVVKDTRGWKVYRTDGFKSTFKKVDISEKREAIRKLVEEAMLIQTSTIKHEIDSDFTRQQTAEEIADKILSAI